MLALKSAHGENSLGAACTRRSTLLPKLRNGQRRTHRLYRAPHGGDATTGVGMLAHQYLLDQPDSALVSQAAPYLAGQAESVRGNFNDYYLWYNCTLAVRTAGGDAWNRWNAPVRDVVSTGRSRRRPVASAAVGLRTIEWSNQGGRVYSTALAVLTLEVYYRFAQTDGRSI